jgi:predicted nuclease of predicted toxin-antitoxin system
LKFLVDMPLSPGLAVWLASKGHDAVHALDLALDRSPDGEILARARREARVVVTADLDYPRLLAVAHAEGPGLILFRGGNYSEQEAMDRMDATLAKIPEEDFPHSIIVIEKARIRQRRLPL